MNTQTNQKPKVLHVTTTISGGGLENMLLNLVARHAAQGCFESVIVTTTDRKPNSLRSEMEKHAKVIDLDLHSILRPNFVSTLREVIEKEKPDVVQTWEYDCGVMTGIALKFFSKIPLVWGVHSLGIPDHPFMEGKVKQSLRRRLIGLASRFLPDRIASCSDRSKSVLTQHHGFPVRRSQWLPNGIDTQRFQPDPLAREDLFKEFSIPPEHRLIGLVARRDMVKNIPLFFTAASILMKEREDVHFFWSGGHPDDADDELRQAWKEISHPERMHLPGFRNGTEKIFPAFDICTLTSHSEAFPMVLLEALACGVLCASTPVGDAPKIIDRFGVTLEKAEPSCLAEAWEKILCLAPEEEERLRKEAVEWVRENFSLEKSAEEYAALYHSLIAK